MRVFRRWLAGWFGQVADWLYPSYAERTGDYGYELTEEQVLEYLTRGVREEFANLRQVNRLLEKEND